jgi:hypothetical protein
VLLEQMVRILHLAQTVLAVSVELEPIIVMLVAMAQVEAQVKLAAQVAAAATELLVALEAQAEHLSKPIT